MRDSGSVSKIYRGFSKTSVFGKATLDLKEKPAFEAVFRKPFPKLTEFWKRLYTQKIKSHVILNHKETKA